MCTTLSSLWTTVLHRHLDRREAIFSVIASFSEAMPQRTEDSFAAV